jgi:hypothetical protein
MKRIFIFSVQKDITTKFSEDLSSISEGRELMENLSQIFHLSQNVQTLFSIIERLMEMTIGITIIISDIWQLSSMNRGQAYQNSQIVSVGHGDSTISQLCLLVKMDSLLAISAPPGEKS